MVPLSSRIPVVVFVSTPLAIASRPALGEPDVSLEFDAAPGCPNESTFVAAVTDRGGRWIGSRATSGLSAIRVTIVASDGEMIGSLRAESGSGLSAERRVRATSCSEVVDALAIVTAIALESGTLSSEAEPWPEKESAPPAAEPVRSAPREDEPPKPRLRGSSFDAKDAIEVERGTVRFERAANYTLSAGAEFGLVPGLVIPRYDLRASVASFVTVPRGSSSLVGPILQVHWSWLGPAERSFDGASLGIYGLKAGLSSCSGFMVDTEGLSVLACAEFSAGWLRTTLREAGSSVEHDGGIGTVGLAADAQYALGGPFHASLRAGTHLQFGARAPERADGSRLFEDPVLGAFVAAGVGLHF